MHKHTTGDPYAQPLEQIPSLLIDLQFSIFSGMGQIQGGDFRNVLILALALLFLKLEGDTTHGTTLDTPYSVRRQVNTSRPYVSIRC